MVAYLLDVTSKGAEKPRHQMNHADNEFLFTSESVTGGDPDQKTAAYSHLRLRRGDDDFTWESTDKADALHEAAGLTAALPA